MTKIQRALISCTDKTGLPSFAKFLATQNIEILSTGGTAKLLKEHDIPVTEVSEHTGFPEIMNGRVKTLHPKIHGGLLGLRHNADHQKQMTEHNILPIDLVVVNLYAFEKTISKSDCLFAEAIENIDIGGPSMLRSAAKNHKDVCVVTDPNDYELIQKEISQNGNVSSKTKTKMALKVFQTTSRYDAEIANYLQSQISPQSEEATFKKTFSLELSKLQDLRYGENPHQKASFYKQKDLGLTNLVQHQGKDLSFNNILDTDAAYRTCLEFSELPTVVIVKHNNPCGVASHQDLNTAFDHAKAGDPVSSFGGIVCLNKTVDESTAQKISETFFEVILAPDYSQKALEIFAKKKNLRVLSLNNFFKQDDNAFDIRMVSGGALIQNADTFLQNIRDAKVVTERKPTANEWLDLEFVWKVAKHVKSNAIVFGKNQQILGVGAGQMSRLDSTKIAAIKAKDSFGSEDILKESAMASDAFFPFRDGLDAATKFGITAVIQPGGSIRDDEVIKAANEKNIAMVFTGTRHFRH